MNKLSKIYHELKSKYPEFNVATQIVNERPEQEMIIRFLPKDAVVLEFGAGIGSTAILIDKLLSNPNHHVVIDPSAKAIENTEIQKNQTKSSFLLIRGFVAKNRKFQEDLWEECKNCKNYLVEELESLINKKFNVLMVDCEGAFLGVMNDFPELLKQVKLIIIEQDGDKENVSETRRLLLENNFKVVYSLIHPYYEVEKLEDLDKLNPEVWHNGVGFHEVWIKF